MRKPLAPVPAWFVVDVDGWPIRGPFTLRRTAIKARANVDTMRPLRVVHYVPRTNAARKP